LADAIKGRYGVNVKLIESGGGVFEVVKEVVKDGELIFSKKAVGRFPEHSEVFSLIDSN